MMKTLLILVFAVVLAGTFSGPAHAQLEIDVTQAHVEPVPIAITSFGGDTEYGDRIAEVVADNLRRSGLFRPIDRAAFIEQPGFDSTPNYANWRMINADGLVVGRASRQPDGQLLAEFRLWDIYGQRQLTGQQFQTSAENWRRVAHIISDAIYERLTGESGYFDTRVVFVSESGPKTERVRRLAIMDQDGHNLRHLTNATNEIVRNPRFSPTRQEITYVSQELGDTARVYLFNIETGQREVVGEFPNMSFAPRFSPDGQRIVMSLQQGGNANIYMMDLRTRQTTRLTHSPSIDTSPSFSPDGNRIVFESDRGGRQQIYVMNADGSNQERISFGQGSYGTPVWSPRGDLIAFTKLSGGRFSIGVMRPDGSGERILTEGFHNEGPTWAPNGRVIMFFREVPGAEGGPQLWTVDLTGRHEHPVRTNSFASDPAWSPLLN